MPHLTAGQQRRVKELQAATAAAMEAKAASPRKASEGIQLTNRTSLTVLDEKENKSDVMKNELEELIASECPLCGEIMIKQTSDPFIRPDEADVARMWSI